jgi:hypothetical protein
MFQCRLNYLNLLQIDARFKPDFDPQTKNRPDMGPQAGGEILGARSECSQAEDAVGGVDAGQYPPPARSRKVS